MTNRTERDASIHRGLLCLLRSYELLRVCVKLVEAFARTKPILPVLVPFGVTGVGRHCHPAYRILGGGSIVMVPVMPVNSMRSTTEAHHEIEKSREQKKGNQTIHFLVPLAP